MPKRHVLVLIPLLLVLAACGGSSSDGAASDGGGASETTAGDGGGSGESACADLEGKPGVIRTFCDGDGVASFTIGDTEGEIGGGQCDTGGGYFSFNAGVVTSSEFEGEAPDYAGFSLPDANGTFSGEGIAASINVDGEAIAITDVSGTHDEDGGSLEGTSLTDQTPVTVEFTC